MTKSETKEAVSPVDLLKAAVTGTGDPKPAAELAATEIAAPRRLRLPPLPRLDLSALDRHRLAVPGLALAVGAVLGGGVMALSRSAAPSNDAVMALSTTLDAGRTETARLGSDIAQLHKVLAELRASTDTARREAAGRSGALGERLTQLDKTLNARTAALGERFEQVEREQNARIAALTTQLDRRPAPAAALPAARTEPTQTGSLADAPRSVEPKAVEAKAADARIVDAKNVDARISEARIGEAKLADARPADVKPKQPMVSEKTPVIDGWALRDIFEGAAILENRKRRLVEVGPGDILPGVGRVEAVERRGHAWVVVTRQGLVTAQPW
ncbi:hypothetical protein [Methylobacterium sp. J-070]|uniref:hypothetical protein n=1 Tax=Methylobacterium sp. J-070 TaxID=2836650 RepID=UPI001FB8F7AD|nr:hypothetical protein [Methylobacterium sp. J-070]MCJ2053518.1 hypothetical protein [Methylobacterium sp. J-070]